MLWDKVGSKFSSKDPIFNLGKCLHFSKRMFLFFYRRMASMRLSPFTDTGWDIPAGSDEGAGKKHVVLLLRWVLIISCSSLILFQKNPGENRNAVHFVVLMLILSNVFLSAISSKWFTSKYFEHSLLTLDILLVTASIWLSGGVKSELYLLYFLVIMIAAVGETIKAIIWSAALVSIVYLAMMASVSERASALDPEILIRIPFFFVVALFYGYFAQQVRVERSKKAEVQKELNAATQLSEISTLLAGTLDRQTIMDSLVSSVLEFCKAEYGAVLSRGTRTVVAESSKGNMTDDPQRCLMLFHQLERHLENAEDKTRPKPVLLNFSAAAVKGDDCQGISEKETFTRNTFSFLPFNGRKDSDLYLCLYARPYDELIDYVGVLLSSASMALRNAAQYQALLHEVEKRQDIVRHLGCALKFKSELTANITHEIRTPIYAFIGFAELLISGGYGTLTTEQQEVISRMLDKARGLLELINHILDHAKLEAGGYKIRLKAGNLREFLEDVVHTCEPLLKDNPVTMQIQCATDLPIVVTDWEVLRQVAMNLVSNAVKFTPRGRVDISAKYDERKKRLIFCVADTGVGIAAEDLQQIFEPFRQLENSYTKKYAGTGLGLSISKKQVEMLGGCIKVKSKLEYGSKFIVELPMQCSEEDAKIVSAISSESLQTVGHDSCV